MLQFYAVLLIFAVYLNGFDGKLRSDRMATRIMSLEFEVFGRVQGVFFRKYTQQQAEQLGIRGWCRNTRSGTVEGALEGYQDKINEMKNWLQYKGSPQSSVDKAQFTEEKEIPAFTISKFEIRN